MTFNSPPTTVAFALAMHTLAQLRLIESPLIAGENMTSSWLSRRGASPSHNKAILSIVANYNQ